MKINEYLDVLVKDKQMFSCSDNFCRGYMHAAHSLTSLCRLFGAAEIFSTYQKIDLSERSVL